MASASNYSLAYVLDDDPGMLRLISKILATRALNSRSFSNISDMFAAMEIAIPNIIILDLALSGGDAIDVLRKLDEMRYNGKIFARQR